jgi:hypothetical protein
MSRVANKRDSVTKRGQTQEISYERWVAKFGLEEINDSEFPAKALVIRDVKTGDIEIGHYLSSLKDGKLCLPLGYPLDFTKSEQTTRFFNFSVQLLRSLTNIHDVGFEVSNLVYSYIIVIATVIRKLLFTDCTQADREKWVRVLCVLKESLDEWLSYYQDATLNAVLERVAVDNFGPDNIERSVSFVVLGKKPTLQQLAEQLGVSVDRSLKNDPTLMTPTKLHKIVFANFCPYKVSSNKDETIALFDAFFGQMEGLTMETVKATFESLTGQNVSEDTFARLVHQNPAVRGGARRNVGVLPDGLEVNGLRYNHMYSARPPVLEVLDDEKAEVDGLSFRVKANRVGGKSQWAGVGVGGRCFKVEAEQIHGVDIAEGMPKKHIEEAVFRVVVDGSKQIMGRGYSSSGVHNLKTGSNPQGAFVYERSRNRRISFLEPFILDLENGKFVQRDFSFDIPKDGVVIGFKNMNLKFTAWRPGFYLV